MDSRFQVKVLAKTENPQQLMYLALHQCYSENFVAKELESVPIGSETKCGEITVKRLLAGNKGHFGILEHPTISLNVGYYPHSVMQQATRHRIATFAVESMRYSGNRIIELVEGKRDIEDIFYLRPVGKYTDRNGTKYEYTQEQRNQHLEYCLEAAKLYAENIKAGMSEEHARSLIPFDFRQHFVVTFNARALMHFLDLRAKKDAQLEIQDLCEKMFNIFLVWMPEVATWYEENRLHKARLAP